MRIAENRSNTVATLAISSALPVVLETDSILAARAIVWQYCDRWKEPRGETAALAVAVQGDYGSGKTFLLQDSIRTFLTALPTPLTPTIILAPCIGGSALSWYQQTIGPALKSTGSLRELVLALYAEAAKDVSGESDLTAAAASYLNNEPASVFRLIKEHKLSPTAVEETMDRRLSEIALNPTIQACFRALVWDETAQSATRWLSGETLSRPELDDLRIATTLDSGALAADFIVAVSRLHSLFQRPFAIFIDELEHLVRYDLRRVDGGSNVTWLKRLLEALAATNALLFVAGHWDAWNAMKSDSLDRFSAHAPITMWRLTDSDIVRLMSLTRPSAPVLNSTTAALIAKLTGGNIRQVLRLLYQVLASTPGSTEIQPAMVEGAAEQLGQKLTIERCIARIEGMLEKRGLDVERQSVVANIKFGVVASVGGRPRVVFEFRDEISQDGVAVVGDVKRFIDQLETAQKTAPGLLGIFISDAGIGSEISDLLARSSASCLAFDLARRDFLDSIERELDMRLGVARGAGAASAIEQLSQQGAALLERGAEIGGPKGAAATSTAAQADPSPDVMNELSAIEARRIQDAEELRQRIDDLTQQLSSEREREVARLVRPADQLKQTLHVAYADVARRTPFSKLFFQAFAVLIAPLVALTIACVVVVWNAERIFPSFISWFGTLVSIVLLVVVMLAFGVQRLLRLQSFDELRVSLLREVYVRTESAALLVQADNLMRHAVTTTGPRQASAEAPKLIFGLLDDAH